MTGPIAVGFDFDHTLGIDNRLERTVALDLLRAYAGRRGIRYDAAEADDAVEDMLAAYREGEYSVEAAVAGFLERFAPGGGATVVDEAGTFRESVIERAAASIEPVPGAREMLGALDAMNVSYALLTNGWSPLQEEKARAIGFAGPVFVSERIGARKPSREAFAALSTYFGLPFERIWYVGDDPAADCAGASILGLKSVWFNADGRIYPPDLPRPDHTIYALAELPPLLASSGAAAPTS